jgi:hypothetical protein
MIRTCFTSETPLFSDLPANNLNRKFKITYIKRYLLRSTMYTLTSRSLVAIRSPSSVSSDTFMKSLKVLSTVQHRFSISAPIKLRRWRRYFPWWRWNRCQLNHASTNVAERYSTNFLQAYFCANLQESTRHRATSEFYLLRLLAWLVDDVFILN